ncbi:FAD-dependent oxidoreductase [Nonomuraea sp. NPDC050536]|uniref:FAD-dependent oxidoreductase n=1 Tax=Nonomuraea sp. NPDC050536 TaxID=3364366 RepID=UPI0037C5EC15
MRVVIVGGGVAGLALARGLRDHEVEILEESPEPRTAGGSVSIWPAGTGILRELGVDPLEAGRRLATMGSHTASGRRMFTVDLAPAESRYGHPTVHIGRRELVGLLARGLDVTYGARVTRVNPDRAEVELADGRTVRGDVLVGADGRRSAVRQALWGRDRARLSGWVTWQGYAELPTGPEVTMYTGRGGLCGLAPSGPDRLLWWLDVRSRPGRPLWGDDPDPVGRLRRRFGTWAAAPVRQALDAIKDAEFFPHYRHWVPAVWGRGPTTLAGDAAHTMPPTMAQGANQALEDAWALSRSIGGDLRAYERRRARIARRPALLAATEMTNVQNPTVSLFSDRMATRAYTAWLRTASSYLRREVDGRMGFADRGGAAGGGLTDA